MSLKQSTKAAMKSRGRRTVIESDAEIEDEEGKIDIVLHGYSKEDKAKAV